MPTKTILCYGDSNTYGYDPRGPIPGRYPADSRWCDLLAEKTSWHVINAGENGRMIPNPAFSWAYSELDRHLTANAPVDAVCIMLGTNDILNSCRAGLTPILDRMEALLDHLQIRWPNMKIVLLAPPPIDIPELEDIDPDSTKQHSTNQHRFSISEILSFLIASYQEIATDRNLHFIETHAWNLPLAYDGVHLSQKGHQIFAENMTAELHNLFF